jgi:formate C-acetyltransferase
MDSLVAQGVTPQSCAMTEGITAAINSCGKIPFEKFAGGASTMWDFDSSWVTEEIVEAVIRTFMEKQGQIFQGNTTSVEELIEAQKNPDEHRNLIVRVGGYSARFVGLNKKVQDDVINRIRHNC